jgi:hypothetical protein
LGAIRVSCDCDLHDPNNSRRFAVRMIEETLLPKLHCPHDVAGPEVANALCTLHACSYASEISSHRLSLANAHVQNMNNKEHRWTQLGQHAAARRLLWY